MGEIKRLYVEKKIGCNVEAQHLLADLRENLGITALTGLRILNRYDVEGISKKDYDVAKTTIFSEPPVDIVYEEVSPYGEGEYAFGTEFLPGQYDQRADSAMQCIQLISQAENVIIALAKVYVLQGENLSQEDIDRIKAYCLNPVDSREAILKKQLSLKMVMEAPANVKIMKGFINSSEEQVEDLRKSLGLAMSKADLLFCQEYFKKTEKREPTITELRVIDTYWSDHCRHTTFNTKIENVDIEEGYFKRPISVAYEEYLKQRDFVYGEKAKSRNITLMDMAVLGMKSLKKQGILNNLDESDEINACSIVVPVDVDGVTEDWLIMFKNETHNHPTEIEPFGGAATCLGGAIRDPLSGRSYVYQAMRVTGAGNPNAKIADTVPGKLPQRKIVTEAARGYSSYGNQIGLATGQVVELYDEGFVAKRMEVGAVIAAAKKSHVKREVPISGDVILLVGGRTGRDGCGGATGSSKEHTEESIFTCGAEVQKGNAPTERKLQRLFRKPNVSEMIKRCNDFGAGGVSVAIGELADGLRINLDAVPKKYDGLDGTELAISESQERMAVVVAKENIGAFMTYAAAENLEATPVATVTNNRRLMMYWRNMEIVDISRDFLDTNGATQTTNITVTMPKNHGFFDVATVSEIEISNNLKSAWLKNLSDLNVASQKGLVERFDSTIGAGTVLMPFGGKNQLTPTEVMVAKIPLLIGETTTATMMSYGYYPKIGKWSPFHGAAYAVVEALSKIVAAGGDYRKASMSFQEYFESLGTDSKKWGKPFAALLGALQAQLAMGVAAIGGKDSMSGTFMDRTVPPTLIAFAVDYANVSQIISPEFKKAGNKVLFIPARRDAYDMPDYEYLKRMYALVSEYIKNGICVAAHTVRAGGVAEAISKMSLGNFIGVKINDEMEAVDFFKPEYGSFVLEIVNSKVIDLKGMDAVVLGETTPEPIISFGSMELFVKDAVAAWSAPLENIFQTKVKAEEATSLEVSLYHSDKVKHKKYPKSIVKPRVLIPVFPGTNCEYDSRRAFELAGAEVTTLVVANLTMQALEETIRRMTDAIKRTEILMLPGGFSAGDEPDGSGKFIAAAFRNPRIKEAVMEMLNRRDGLMLGICNGFQALVKLGLVPYGDIRPMETESPTLTYNKIGRHVSNLVHTQVVSNHSPWLWGTTPGDVHTIPVSHGEGRFVAPKAVIDKLVENRQIATQYVDLAGRPTMDIRFNPNGSMLAIEGITSPDGRIFGKMAHSERIGNGLYKNVTGSKDQKIFESGVDYFRS